MACWIWGWFCGDGHLAYEYKFGEQIEPTHGGGF